MATSGTTSETSGSRINWKIRIYWERTGYNVDRLEEYIKAKADIGYYTTTGISSNVQITINGTTKSAYVSAPDNWNNGAGAGAPFAWRASSAWQTWTIPMDEAGNASINVSGSFPINFYNLSTGKYENPTCGPNSWSLDNVPTYSKVYGGPNGNFSKNKYVYKTNNYGNSWSKCNAYKTTNSGSNWSKIQ